jgi:dihydroflavonol-4-reductase
MKILITGASGLLGGHVTRQLYHEGHEIRLFLRKSSIMNGINGHYSEVYFGDLANEADVKEAVRGCDAVVHSASLTATEITDFKYYEAANVKGTINLVKASISEGIKKFVYVSTANTIGPGTKQAPGTELSELNLFKFNSGYINSKYLAQQYILEQVEKFDFPAVVVNPTFMIGSHDYKPSSGKMILIGLGSKIQICPDGGKNFISVEDAARGVGLALERGKIGECYLLAGHNLTYKEFFMQLNEISGHKAIQVVVPKLIFNGIGLGGTMVSKMIRKPLPLNLVNTRVLSLDNYYSGNKAVKELGLKITPLNNAIEGAVKWFADNGYLK